MTDEPRAVPPGLADLPRGERERLAVETHRELHDGLTSRHLAIAAEQQAHDAVQFARILHMGRVGRAGR